MRKIIAVFVVLLCFSCKGKKRIVPAGILEPQKMQAVFWDYIRADVFTRDFIKKPYLKTDTLENIRLQNKIFDFYKISRKEFYKSYAYYTEHSELMGVIIDSMIAKHSRPRSTKPVKPRNRL